MPRRTYPHLSRQYAVWKHPWPAIQQAVAQAGFSSQLYGGDALVVWEPDRRDQAVTFYLCRQGRVETPVPLHGFERRLLGGIARACRGLPRMPSG